MMDHFESSRWSFFSRYWRPIGTNHLTWRTPVSVGSWCVVAATFVACSGNVGSGDEWHDAASVAPPGSPAANPGAGPSPIGTPEVTQPGASSSSTPEHPDSTPQTPAPEGETPQPTTPAPVFETGDPNAVGPRPLQRLNHREYNNTVRDLLGTSNRAADAFSSDRSSNFAFPRAGVVSTLEAELLMDAAEELANELDLDAWLGCSAEAPDAACVEDFLRNFSTAAYRRPSSSEELDRLNTLYAELTQEVALSPEQGLRAVVQAVLQSPAFLYHWELGAAPPTAEGSIAPLTNYELASRLSYLIWAAPPDAALLTVAAAGELSDPVQLQAQVTRLLADDKARSAVAGFFLDWATVNPDQVIGRDKDLDLYPEFNAQLATAMAEETGRFAETVVFDGDGTLRSLLTGTTSVVSRDLADLYGFNWNQADDVGEVEHDPSQRMGLFTQAAFLTVSGAAIGSNPVKRGHKIYSTLLCKDVPPPSGIDVPAPAPPSSGGTTRDRYAEHGKSPCASCHTEIDPLGFAFEHYDGIGRYRTLDNGLPVDASATYTLDGKAIDYANATELMQQFAQSREVSDCVAKQWLRYGLGRDESSDDTPSVQSVAEAFATSAQHFPTLIAAVATSRSFRYRTLAAGER